MAWLRRGLMRLQTPTRAVAEAAFLQLAGTAAPIAWLEWLPGFALLGVVLVLIWLLPSNWFAGAWLDTLLSPRERAAVVWGLLVVVPVAVELVRARWSRERLATAYAAADAALGGTFLRFPGSLVGAACLLVAAWLPGLDALGWVAAALAAQATSELAIRCLVASAGRLRQAGRVVARGLRHRATAWLVVAAGAVWLLPSLEPRPPAPEQLASQWRSDPAVTAADAALHQAFAAARDDGHVPSQDLLRLRAEWDVAHTTDDGIPGALSADALMQDRLRAAQAFWITERDRPYGSDDLAVRCAAAPPTPACRIRQTAAPVPGSDGTLLYRVGERGDLPPGTTFDAGWAPELIDVFQAAGRDNWRYALRVAYSPGHAPRAPRQVASPAGSLLVLPPASPWSIQLGEEEGGEQVYLQQGAAWRRIDAASWLRQAAAALPAHQCLHQTTYGFDKAPLATELKPDYGSFTLLGRYGPRSGDLDWVNGLVRFSFAIEDRVLVVRGTSLTVFPDARPWWRRWLASGPEC